uniref:Uncharacterized protein n=1 Tax=uncultured Desulfobacterium sp. TaxID=201089 RepID=E1YDI1_9BACT|nr:unknown protein [uncultured Desulfobacterium sp.]
MPKRNRFMTIAVIWSKLSIRKSSEQFKGHGFLVSINLYRCRHQNLDERMPDMV